VPGTVLGAKLVVALVVQGSPGLDAGRAAQNMMLAGWNEGVTSCPNGMPDRDKTAGVLGLGAHEQVLNVLAFGYPARPRNPERHAAEEWIARANRRPFDDVVEIRRG
jgi:nitroreductase